MRLACNKYYLLFVTEYPLFHWRWYTIYSGY